MPKLEKDQYTKAEAEDLLRQASEENAEALEVAKREAEMSDAEKEIYKSLEGDAKSEFLFATKEERQVEITKAADENPVVYKSLNGTEFRKNDDPRMVTMAKERDEERKEFLDMKKAREQETFEKRADSELPHLAGDVKVRAAILKAVESIADEDTRKEALKSLKAKDANLAKAYKENGSGGINTDDDVNKGGQGSNAFEELDAKAKEICAKNTDISYYTAFEQASQENPELAKRAVQEG